MKKLLAIAILTVVAVVGYAQNKKRTGQYIYQFDKTTGKLKGELVRKINHDNDYICQYTISYIDSAGVYHNNITVDSIEGYNCDDGVHLKKTITLHGKQQTAFLHRLSDYNIDDLVFFDFVDEVHNTFTFVQMDQKKDELEAIEDYESTGYVSPLRMKLLSSPNAQSKKVTDYINKKKMTPESYEHLSRLLKAGRVAGLPRIRWGVTANVGLQSVSHGDDKFDASFKAAGGLFADIPLFSIVTLHPEILFSKYHAKGELNDHHTSWIVNNVTVIDIPVLARVNFPYLRGKFVPYVDLGYQFGLALKNKYDWQYVVNDIETEFDNHQQFGPFASLEKGGEEGKKLINQGVAGLGVEWQFSETHSAFIELRVGIGDKVSKSLSVSFNI